MQDKKMIEEASLVEGSTAKLGGLTVKASAIYEDDDEGEPMVDLHIEGRLFAELVSGDRIPVAGDMWEVVNIQPARNKVKQGVIVLRRE